MPPDSNMPFLFFYSSILLQRYCTLYLTSLDTALNSGVPAM